VSPDGSLQAEQDENTCRKGFLPTEAVSIALAIEQREKERAKERQKQGQSNGAATTNGRRRENKQVPDSGKLPESAKAKTNGDTRDHVAAKVGMSGKPANHR
jgi:hypothetical protein